jgi:Lon protease-like protein
MISSVYRRTIPIFPLANVVLFPSISVPLYIFEPRYRAMIRAAQQGDRRIGMVAIRPEAVSRISDTPAVFSTGCEGEIDQARERPDGTFDIRLVATHRFRIIEEIGSSESRPYRVARVQSLDEEALPPEFEGFAAARENIFRVLCEIIQYGAATDEDRPSAESLASLKKLEDFGDEQFVHVVAQATDLGVLEKQRLLEAPGTLVRYRMLDELLRFRLSELKVPTAPGSTVLQ